MAAEQRHIDHLLQRYLSLLDEYVRLRGLLSGLQVNIYQNIARANFSAERGTRYGQDSYDERMRASRLLAIHRNEADVPVFAIRETIPDATAAADDKQPAEGNKGPDDEHHDQMTRMARDPLRWFGLLVPAPLRKAQSLSIEMVEHAIPQLASVHAEMLSVEIAVRRARKRRAKGSASVTQTPPETVEAV